ncbi:MAG TPA: glutathione S-transferase family protein [Gammaproteobacteria bacterium]|nr:glutathione S-transferase family protein [Gammaproteobacteria bacterium]
MTRKPVLISFSICPFVQRSVITLLEKKVDFKLTYIDLNNPPEWFVKISPLGKVPVLKVDDVALFESAVINEYLDEVNPPTLHPVDSLLRAQNRAWIEFGSDMIMNHYNMMIARDSDAFTNSKNRLVHQVEQLEQILGEGPYFNGEGFSLVDAAFAPLFMRIDLLDERFPLNLYQINSRVARWSGELIALDSVRNSVTPDFAEVYSRFVTSLDSYYSTKIKATSV